MLLTLGYSMRPSICLLCSVVLGCSQVGVRGTKDSVTSPTERFLETINKILPVLIDVFNSVFGEVNKAAFRSALDSAVGLVDRAFPARAPPRLHEPWWGDHQLKDNGIRKFTVQFSDEMISDLRGRILSRRNLTRALRGAANTYGTHADYLSRFLHHWALGYDFGARENWLNSFPQYVTNVQGLDIHFIHLKPLNPHKKVLPLLLLHGFPVSAFEYVHVIKFLTEERDDCDFVFEMIVPDLPGYAYSEATNKIGMAPYQMGIIMKNLMLRLGKPRFYIHAGDIGYLVGDAIATLFPERVLGFHSNLPISHRPQSLTKWVLGQLYPPAVVEAQYEDRMYPLSARLQFYLENLGYFHLQATKPDNVGHGLDESPVAVASWLLENIMVGTDPTSQFLVDGNLTGHYDMNDWFDSFTINWASQSMTTAARSYAEFLAVKSDPLSFGILITPTPVPYAAIRFRYEIIYMPDDFLRDKYPNLLQSTTVDFGGHFAAYEEPAVLSDSIWTSVAKMEAYHENRG